MRARQHVAAALVAVAARLLAAWFITITWADHVFGIVESPWGSGVLLLLMITAVVALIPLDVAGHVALPMAHRVQRPQRQRNESGTPSREGRGSSLVWRPRAAGCRRREPALLTWDLAGAKGSVRP